MRYKHIFEKMSQPLRDSIAEQAWCQNLIKQGTEMTDLLTDKNHLAVLLKHMSIAETQTLRLIVSACGCEPFTKEVLEKQAALSMAGARVTVGLIGLRKVGVITAFRKAWGEQLWVLPEDAFGAWQTLLYPEITFPTLAKDLELNLVEAASSSARGLAQQLLHFFVACFQQLDLPLTNKGALHKKQLQKLSDHLIALPRESLHRTGLSYAFNDVYDEGMAVMLEMGFRLGILVHTDHRFLMEHKALHDWLKLSYDEQQGQLYGLWRDMHLPAPAWLQHAISLMDGAEHGVWCRLDDMTAWIEQYAFEEKMLDRIAIHTALMEQWIEMLCRFRWLEIAVDTSGHSWFRWLIAGDLTTVPDRGRGEEHPVATTSAPRSLYVQPDFELLLPPDISLALEWEIAAFADLVSSDIVRTYRITKESFHRASERGSSSERILLFLQQHACYDIPEPVVLTLQQWDRQTGKLHIEEVTLLRCESADVAESLLRNEKCSSFLEQRLGSCDFIIKAEHQATMRKQLEQMGYHPRVLGKDIKLKELSSISNQAGSITEATTVAAGKPKGLFYSRDAIQLYEMDTSLSHLEGLYPNMEGIPTSWIKEFRDYHASTRKEMIRKAIEWKSCLQLRKKGHDRFVIPKALYEERTGWSLVGFEKQKEIILKSEDWEEMKLILPGINDEEKEETL
ncbi:hypothetical protein GK047_05350 [Paenibacillus sp. SYP-B3998]|uniref:Helicase XPB/Ssl2 N-terminal domain-containing protein n=1 Tax=Paenibacillus sp. SYP-B3998 TaxID=2678564 RepID=A0A6G3ZTB4_9BACL|nr:helicase-associated domain-containing protein [Paenibacillus sp. SYP-B3998]NEW05443.1 hypothetical protein [Paenibacillus sp. SYP-B3998]